MSRIGKKPVAIPAGVKIEMDGTLLTVTGPKGKLTENVHPEILIEVNGKEALVKKAEERADLDAMHGLYRANLQNMVTGVTAGYTKTLDVNGVGWKVALKGKKLVMNIGFSHPVEFEAEEGITYACPDERTITVSGIDKVAVGQVAANIRALRKCEPYHGYGIKYRDEVIERKEGKTSGKGKK